MHTLYPPLNTSTPVGDKKQDGGSIFNPRAPSWVIFCLLTMSQFTAPETAITFDEPLIDDRFDLELFMMAPPFTNARTWGEKLALIEHHKAYPGSVPGLIYPYKYTSTVNVNIMPEDVFSLNKKVCCVRCGAAIHRCLSRKGGCASKKRGVTHLIQREAVNNGGYQLDNEPSSAQGSSRSVTKEVQRLELFEEAKRKPDNFSSRNLKLDYAPKRQRHRASEYSDVPSLARMGSGVYCMLCGFTYAKCMAKNPGCSRHAGPP